MALLGPREQLAVPLPAALMCSPFHPRVQEDWENLVQTLRAHLENIFFPDLVEEWMEENINPYLDRLRAFVKDYREVIRLNARPKVL